MKKNKYILLTGGAGYIGSHIAESLEQTPLKTIIVDKVEADDIITYLSGKVINQREDRSFIVSSDKDFLQLINENIVVYRPMEKKYYTTLNKLNKMCSLRDTKLILIIHTILTIFLFNFIN